MRKPRADKERVRCQNFTWLIGKRNGTYSADGRGNQIPLGRYSLGARDHSTAMKNLADLDRVKAVEHGLSEREVLDGSNDCLSLADGWQLYEVFFKRPVIMGGTRKPTHGAYQGVFRKFCRYAASEKITSWQQVTKRVLEKYARWLTEKNLGHQTLTFHLTILKQTNKFLVDEGHLPESCRIKLRLQRERDSNRYCWTTTQVQAMVELCRSQPELHFLADILQTLALTGMRIAELMQLRWSDLQFEPVPIIKLVDESRQVPTANGSPRTLKNGRSRSFPMHAQLVAVLQNIARHPDGFVFHDANGERLKYQELRRLFVQDVLLPLAPRFPNPAGEKGFPDGRFHSFRHYFCSINANNNVPERALMSWLGHSDSAMIRRYYHLDAQESQRLMNRISIPGVSGGIDAAAVSNEETNVPQS